nr:NADH dehydrogenase subunit 4 [Lepidophthirus macrorhini]
MEYGLVLAASFPMVLNSKLFVKKMFLMFSMALGTLWMVVNFPMENFKASQIWYWDCFSWVMIIITMWVVFLIVFITSSIFMTNLFVVASVSSLVFFMSSNWLWLFISFELSLIPIYLVITCFGEHPERMRAGLYLMMYTMFASVPLFITLIYKLKMEGTSSLMLDTIEVSYSEDSSILFMMAMMIAFMVKMPVFLSHSWLPKAHVESPLGGSVFLASILLKFGSYGVYRSFMIFPWLFSSTLMWVFYSVALIGAVYGALMSLTSTDLKVIIAYASVSHMNLGMATLLCMKFLSLKSFLISMISHSLCSGLLFLTASISMGVTNTRSVVLSKGVLSTFPVLVMVNFLTWSLNVSVPPSLSFIGEIYSVLSNYILFSFSLLLILVYIFISSIYSITLYSVSSSSNEETLFKSSMPVCNPLFNSFFMIIPLVILFFFSNILLFY